MDAFMVFCRWCKKLTPLHIQCLARGMVVRREEAVGYNGMTAEMAQRIVDARASVYENMTLLRASAITDLTIDEYEAFLERRCAILIAFVVKPEEGKKNSFELFMNKFSNDKSRPGTRLAKSQLEGHVQFHRYASCLPRSLKIFLRHLSTNVVADITKKLEVLQIAYCEAVDSRSALRSRYDAVKEQGHKFQRVPKWYSEEVNSDTGKKP